MLVAHTCAALGPGPTLLLRVGAGVNLQQVGVTLAPIRSANANAAGSSLTALLMLLLPLLPRATPRRAPPPKTMRPCSSRTAARCRRAP